MGISVILDEHCGISAKVRFVTCGMQADAIFKSDAANPDRQLLNTDVGFLEMMRFKGM